MTGFIGQILNANFVLCIPGYKTLVTKIVQKSLSPRIYEELNCIEKLFKDRI